MSRLAKFFLPLRLSVPAILSGLLLAATIAPLQLGLLSFVALVPLLFALLRTPHSPSIFFKTGYVFGAAYSLGHLWWVSRLSSASSITIPWLIIPAQLLLVLYLALFYGLFCWLLRLVGRNSIAGSLIAAPGLWFVVEWVRANGELGFPWGALGYALTPYPMLLQGASYVGVFGLGLIIVIINSLISGAFLFKNGRARFALPVVAMALALALAIQGTRQIEQFDNAEVPTTHIAIAQPNVDLHIKWDPAYRDSTLRLIDRLTRQAALLKPQIIVFPETSAPVYIHHDVTYKKHLSALARELNTGIFIGFLDGRYDTPDELLNVYNSSGFFSPDGSLTQYDKQHLLPFGEAIPFAWRFRTFSKLDFGQANFLPGRAKVPVASTIGGLAPLICFESIFADLSRKSVNSGASVLLNITNDSWFGETPGRTQHSDMSILRAVENRRYLLRSANSGLSMVVDPMGRIISSLELDKEGILWETIGEVTGKTLYTRMGDVPALLVALLLCLTGAITARFAPRTHTAPR